mmetsp:Transcript_8457/g.18323  ORF Transcript_8457/g.18323 Transcript_8457/m.18323 type:complete len:289 (-) Transcript_8457:11-877(-)
METNGKMPEDNVLRNLVEEDEAEVLEDWTRDNHKRSDVFEVRLEAGDKFREEGNEHFKAGKFAEARRSYLLAMYQIDFDCGQQWQFMEQHQLQLDNKKLRIFLNLCAVGLKLGHNEDVIKFSKMALIFRGRMQLEKDVEAKLLYRQGLAHLNMEYPERAEKALMEAKGVEPEDKAIAASLAKAQKLLKEEHKKQKEYWKTKLQPAMKITEIPKEEPAFSAKVSAALQRWRKSAWFWGLLLVLAALAGWGLATVVAQFLVTAPKSVDVASNATCVADPSGEGCTPSEEL